MRTAGSSRWLVPLRLWVKRVIGRGMTITGDGSNTTIAFNANDSVVLVGFVGPQAPQTADFVLA
jgi:hypothetical protein